MIFTRISVGKIVKLWPMREEPMCHLPLFLFQPLSLRIAVGGWGNYGLWEWGGRTVSPHPHAHSTMVDSTMEKMLTHFQFWGFSPFFCSSLTQTFFHSPHNWEKMLTHLQFASPPLLCILMQRDSFPFFHLHAQDFAGFTHAVVFFCGFVNSEAISFTHGLIHGFCIVAVPAPAVRP